MAASLAALAGVVLSAAVAAPVALGAGPAHASIVGGRIAAHGTFPWLAFVVDSIGEGEGTCSGTVVASNLVLTAGHCAEDTETGEVRDPAGYRVVTGSVDWTSPEREVSGVSQVIVYPHYEAGGASAGWGDAALLELSAPIRAPAIELAGGETWRPGTEAAIVGWGMTGHEGEVPVELRWASTRVQSGEWCRENAPGFHPLGQLCAIDSPRFASGACYGDSGGPLLALQPGTREWAEIGITSSGYGDCSTTLPDVFTRSDLVAGWVNARIGELSPPLRSPVPPPAGATRLPAMGSAQAAAYVRRGLTEDFGVTFTQRLGYRATCRRIEAPRQRCAVSWSHGPNDYYGSVTVYYVLDHGEVLWGKRYTISHVNDRCYFHSRHRQRCRIYTRRR